jgi:hypothetical protein
MNITPNVPFTFPTLGSKGQWGTTINNNFHLTSQYITKLSSEIAATRTLIGAGAPYYKELYDNNNTGPYKFIYIDTANSSKPTFTYCTDLSVDASNVLSPSGSTIQYDNINNIPAYIGAYVINQKSVSIDGVSYKKGDLIVTTQLVGSILDDTYITMRFKKYPDTGFYIEPSVKLYGQNSNTAVRITYSKHDYVDYTMRDAEHTYTIVPAYHYYEQQFNKNGQATYTFSNPTGKDDVPMAPSIFIYEKNGTTMSPIYCDYTITVTTNDKFTVAVQIDSKVVTRCPNLYCQICVGYNINETYKME